MVALSISAFGGKLRTTTCLLRVCGPFAVPTVNETVYVPLSAKMWQVTGDVGLHGCGWRLDVLSPKSHCQLVASLEGLVRSVNWITRPSAASAGEVLKSTTGG